MYHFVILVQNNGQYQINVLMDFQMLVSQYFIIIRVKDMFYIIVRVIKHVILQHMLVIHQLIIVVLNLTVIEFFIIILKEMK